MKRRIMTSITLNITGMTCGHCASAIEQALNTLPGVRATVSYGEGIAAVEPKKIKVKRFWIPYREWDTVSARRVKR